MPARPLPVRAALLAIRGYQLLFSPMYAGSCRFVPSCSAYAVEAIERFGVVRGTALTIRRLSRCHPLGSHGLDPVPAPRGAAGSLPRRSSEGAKAGA